MLNPEARTLNPFSAANIESQPTSLERMTKIAHAILASRAGRWTYRRSPGQVRRLVDRHSTSFTPRVSISNQLFVGRIAKTVKIFRRIGRKEADQENSFAAE
jgi:hypothetical protein